MKTLIQLRVAILLSLILSASFTSFGQQFLTQVNSWNAYVHLPANYNNTTQKYPAIIYFPGLNHTGTNANLVIQSGPGAYIAQGWDGNVSVDGSTVEFIVISLQPSSYFPNESLINQRLQTLKSQYRIDADKIYFAGFSAGGWCVSTFVTGDAYNGPYNYASQIAAAVTVLGMKPDDNQPYPALFDNFAVNGGKYLGFEQRNDGRDTRTVVNRMNATSPGSAFYVQTNFSNGGHCCESEYFGGEGKTPGNFSINGISQNLYQWLARISLGITTPSNLPPVSNAGPNRNITLPINTASLSGSGSDPDGLIASYLWTKVSGPSAGTISNPSSASTSANGLVQGTYTFQLRVTDDDGATATDLMTVTVNPASNQPPVANAGSDRSVTLPSNSVSISGGGTDPDGSITSYLWTKLSGPAGGTISNSNAASMVVSGLNEGVYDFQLRVTDNSNATATDVMRVFVNAEPAGNQLPVANAGADAAVTLPSNSVSLNGSGSDPDGSIVSYSWAKTAGPSAGTINFANSAQATVSGLTQGIYTFELTVTDNQGALDTDMMQVTVYGNTATGQKINVNIFNGSNSYNNTQWNNWNTSSGLNSTNFKYEDGSQSSVSASLNTQAGVADNGSNYATSSNVCPSQILRHNSYNTSYRNLVIKGLNPAKTYHIEFFGSRANSGNKTVFNIGNKYDTITTDHNANDFAKFDNIQPAANGNVTTLLISIGTYNYIAGFTIVEEMAGRSGPGIQGEPLIVSSAIDENPIKLKLYPNPVTDMLRIEHPGPFDGEVSIYVTDISGRIVLQKKAHNRSPVLNESLNTTYLRKGNYFLIIQDNKGKISRQLLKQ